jgi:hypothetical protein
MRLALATAFALIVLPATTKGQTARIDALSLQAGARARIFGPTTYPNYELITVASVSLDSLRYSLDRGLDTRSSIAWQQISKMDASMGSHRNIGRGAGIGLLVGAIGGAVLGSNVPGNEFRGMQRIVQDLFYGALGGLGGAVLGFASHPDGSIQIRDRTKDVIKSGGEWVSSVALENAIMGHFAVAEAAVIGVPEAKWMERPIAIVVCKPGQTVTHEALVAFLEPQFPKWWMPDATEFVDVLPKSGAGKFQKSVLRERFARRLTAGWEKAR